MFPYNIVRKSLDYKYKWRDESHHQHQYHQYALLEFHVASAGFIVVAAQVHHSSSDLFLTQAIIVPMASIFFVCAPHRRMGRIIMTEGHCQQEHQYLFYMQQGHRY